MGTVDGRPRILIADDDAGTRLMVSAALEQAGFDVLEGESGEEAVELFERRPPDLVILDVVMPGMDGFEACARMRASHEGGHVPIVMMTGLDDVASIARAYDVGATDFLTKPINYVILEQRLRYILRATATAIQLRESEARLAHAQRMARLASWSWNPDGTETSWSQELYELIGACEASLPSTLEAFASLVHPEDTKRFNDYFAAVLDGQTLPPFEHRLVRPDGDERTLSHITEAVRDPQGRVALVLGTVQDVTERRRQEQRIAQLVYFDELTGLPNRAFVAQALGRRIEQAERLGRPLALLSVGLDRFRRINNTLGHAAGDKLLCDVAARLRHCLRWSDTLALSGGRRVGDASGEAVDTLARVGADEFLVLISEVRRPEDAAVVAQRILDTFDKRFEIDETEFAVTASIGIIVYPDNGRDPETLLGNADAAMQHAKERGRNSYMFFSRDIQVRAAARLSLETRLRRAVDRGDFELHYQPKVDPSTGEARSAEALLRWRTNEGELVSPLDFIPLAEESGLIVPMGDWALEQACRQLADWRRAGTPMGTVSVNLSGVQFHGGRLTRQVADLVDRYRLPAGTLELEVTESILIEDTSASRQLLHELREIGVDFSVDDFGTGYSSMSYLKRFPLHALKIDRCFVVGLEQDVEDRAIVQATIALGHGLGLAVVAEGVETRGQLDIVRSLGCDEVQGYYYARPLPSVDFDSWLRGRSTPAAANA